MYLLFMYLYISAMMDAGNGWSEGAVFRPGFDLLQWHRRIHYNGCYQLAHPSRRHAQLTLQVIIIIIYARN